MVAIQFGSMKVVEKWLDMNQELRLQGCYGLRIMEANIGGFGDDFGLLYCKTAPESTRTEDAVGTLDWNDCFKENKDKIDVKNIIFRTAPSIYRLMILVELIRETHTANSTSAVAGITRIIDPTAAIAGLMGSKCLNCTHV